MSGIRATCPPGTFGDKPGRDTPYCSGYCPPGFECPLGTADPVECNDGWYASGGDHACVRCPDDSAVMDPDTLRGLGMGFSATLGRGTELGNRCKHSRECCEL